MYLYTYLHTYLHISTSHISTNLPAYTYLLYLSIILYTLPTNIRTFYVYYIYFTHINNSFYLYTFRFTHIYHSSHLHTVIYFLMFFLFLDANFNLTEKAVNIKRMRSSCHRSSIRYPE